MKQMQTFQLIYLNSWMLQNYATNQDTSSCTPNKSKEKRITSPSQIMANSSISHLKHINSLHIHLRTEFLILWNDGTKLVNIILIAKRSQ